MCRKAHGAAFGTYYYMSADAFRWTSDLDSIVDYESSPSLTRSFCGTCGSVTPNIDDNRNFMFDNDMNKFISAYKKKPEFEELFDKYFGISFSGYLSTIKKL